jgi:hypothetical protein
MNKQERKQRETDIFSGIRQALKTDSNLHKPNRENIVINRISFELKHHPGKKSFNTFFMVIHQAVLVSQLFDQFEAN